MSFRDIQRSSTKTSANCALAHLHRNRHSCRTAHEIARRAGVMIDHKRTTLHDDIRASRANYGRRARSQTGQA